MGATEQLEARLQQIAQRITPCPVPDVFEGWDLCAHGLPWPCPSTEAAWIARGLDLSDQVRACQAWVREERAAARRAGCGEAIDSIAIGTVYRSRSLPRPG